MKTTDMETPEASLAELEMACRLWIAASEAKDEHIDELQQEVAKLRRRVTRLGRMLGSGQGRRRRARATCGR